MSGGTGFDQGLATWWSNPDGGVKTREFLVLAQGLTALTAEGPDRPLN
jgi:hypothetical protein